MAERCVCLGPFGSNVTQQQYDTLIREWRANGGKLETDQPNAVDVNGVFLEFLRHAKRYYVKDGKQTNEVWQFKAAIRIVQPMYGNLPAIEFKPLQLKAVRERMIQHRWSRKHLNKQVARIVRMFKWAAGEELVPAADYQELDAVPGLKSCTNSRKTESVKPVDDATIPSGYPRKRYDPSLRIHGAKI